MLCLFSPPTRASRLILGPWNHTGGWRPTAQAQRADFDHDGELFEVHRPSRQGGRYGHRLRAASALLHHEPLEVGRHLARRPPPRRAYLSADRQLRRTHRLRQRCRRIRGGSNGRNGRALTLALASGHRWTLLRPDRKAQDAKHADCTPRPSPEVTGHGVVTLFITSTSSDWHLHPSSMRKAIRSARPLSPTSPRASYAHPPPAQRRAAAVPPGGPLPNVRERGRVA